MLSNNFHPLTRLGLLARLTLNYRLMVKKPHFDNAAHGYLGIANVYETFREISSVKVY